MDAVFQDWHRSGSLADTCTFLNDLNDSAIDRENMDKQTRRERLRLALSGRQIKTEDQSYISQLLSGTVSFGEKAARRLERDYLLPAMSLDQPFEVPIADHLTKDVLISRIGERLAKMHIEKVKALAIILEA